jgi:hypothetical protein
MQDTLEYRVSASLMNAIYTYLRERPHKEVDHLVSAIKGLPATVPADETVTTGGIEDPEKEGEE